MDRREVRSDWGVAEFHSMQIQVNGESRRLRGEMNVTGLLQDLQLNVERVAVEINLEILERRDFDARMLKEGDCVEIMSFIGGGAPVRVALSDEAFPFLCKEG